MSMRLLDLSAKLLILLSKDEGQDLIESAMVVALIALGATAALLWTSTMPSIP